MAWLGGKTAGIAALWCRARHDLRKSCRVRGWTMGPKRKNGVAG